MIPTLFMSLPDNLNSPASAARDPLGNVYFSSPNLNNDLLDAPEMPCIGKIDLEGNLTPWYQFGEADVSPLTGKIAPMGIAFGPDGHLYVADLQLWFDGGEGESRLLRILVDQGQAQQLEVLASGFMFPNGVAWRGDHLFITESVLKTETGDHTISGVYCLPLASLDPLKPLKISRYEVGQPQDPYLFERFVTSGKLGFGANGLAFDDDGHLYTGLMEDGILMKTSFKDLPQQPPQIEQTRVFAQGLTAPDGMIWDGISETFYVADLFANAIVAIDRHGTVETLAQNGDSDGANGELDAPSEVVVRGRQLLVLNFDQVFEFDSMVNKSSQRPFTLSAIDL